MTKEENEKLIAEALETADEIDEYWLTDYAGVSDLLKSLADALTASIPRQVTTVEELESLPVGSILRAKNGQPVLIELYGTIEGRKEIRFDLLDDIYYDSRLAVLVLAPLTVLHIGGEQK